MTAPDQQPHSDEGPVFEKSKVPRGYCQNPFIKKKCVHSSSEYYCIEDGNDCDSGHDYFCNHPSVGKKATPAHHGEVPDWCPCLHLARQNDPAAIAAAARAEAIIECRKIVGDKVISNKCPFNGDCAQCFLCDNAGGCIVRSDEEIAKLCKGSRADGAREERERWGLAIDQWLLDHDCRKGEHPGYWWIPSPFPGHDLIVFLESLRSQQPGGEDGGAGK